MHLERSELPFYLAYTDPSVETIRGLVSELGIKYQAFDRFKHYALPRDVGRALIAEVPLHEHLNLWEARVSVFITPPRTYYRAHRDGFDLTFGVNYPISIRDDLAVTRWYDDELIERKYQVAPDGKKSREVLGFNPLANKPVCKFTMQNDEAIVLNVDRYHDFHNKSPYHRVIVTFRSQTLTPFADVADRFLKSMSSEAPPVAT